MIRSIKILGLALVAALAFSAVVAAVASAGDFTGSNVSAPATELAISLTVGSMCALSGAGLRTKKSDRCTVIGLYPDEAVSASKPPRRFAGDATITKFLSAFPSRTVANQKVTPTPEKQLSKNPSERNVQLNVDSKNDRNSLIICPAMAC